MSNTRTVLLHAVAAPSLRLRRARAEDAPALSAFLQALSNRSRRLRFHGGCAAASASLARQLCGVDGVRHQAWVACTGAGDASVIVGEARFVVSGCGRRAELAIAVADAWHGRGVADALMRQLLDAATAAGVGDLHGDVLHDNTRMQAFMHRHGFAADPFERGDALRMTRDLGVAAPQPTGGRLLAWLDALLCGMLTRPRWRWSMP